MRISGMIITPQTRLLVAAFIVLLAAISATHLALQAPMFDINFSADDNGDLFINTVRDNSANVFRVHPGEKIKQINHVQLDNNLLIDEPDQLGSWQAYNDFLTKLAQIAKAVKSGQVRAQTDAASTVLQTRARTISDLPLMYWYQVAVGALAFLIAGGVYAFRHQDHGAVHFAIAGLALFASATTAAVYSTRELIIDGNIVRILSAINEFGAIFFTAALVALLWEYPKRIHHNRFTVPLVYLAALLMWTGFVLQLYPDTGTIYALILVLFSVSFLFAFVQWKKSAYKPVARAALKWYLLSIYIGTGLFATLILFPVALGVKPPASQGLMFIVFLFMFVGIALGITRYRLFELDRWWLTAWMWFLGGLLVVATDALLLWLLEINQATSLALSLALIGWVYFPARQWLFTRLRREKSDRNRQIHNLVHSLFSAETPTQLAELWHQYLTKEFDVLELQIMSGTINKPYINNDGQNLIVPHLLKDQHIVLMHPQHGGRLFNRHDQETASLLYTLASQARDALQTRQLAHEEKQRIFSDLHDDVGAKLLSLFYRAGDSSSSELARSALQDLRDVVSQPDDGVLPLNDALADWRAESQERLDNAGLMLNWQQDELPSISVEIFRLRHLARILREALNNILKHAQASKVDIVIKLSDERLTLSVSDNGSASDPDSWVVGRGISNIRHRLEKLAGSGEWQRNEQGNCTLQVSIPINN